jgi:hypothetical protein
LVWSTGFLGANLPNWLLLFLQFQLQSPHCYVVEFTLLSHQVHIARLPTPHEPSSHCQLAKPSSSCELPKFSSDQYFFSLWAAHHLQDEMDLASWECELGEIVMWMWTWRLRKMVEKKGHHKVTILKPFLNNLTLGPTNNLHPSSWLRFEWDPLKDLSNIIISKHMHGVWGLYYEIQLHRCSRAWPISNSVPQFHGWMTREVAPRALSPQQPKLLYCTLPDMSKRAIIPLFQLAISPQLVKLLYSTLPHISKRTIIPLFQVAFSPQVVQLLYCTLTHMLKRNISPLFQEAFRLQLVKLLYCTLTHMPKRKIILLFQDG